MENSDESQKNKKTKPVCIYIRASERNKGTKQTNSYLITEMLIFLVCFLKRYKWLISIGPLENKQALCLCSAFVLSAALKGSNGIDRTR